MTVPYLCFSKYYQSLIRLWLDTEAGGFRVSVNHSSGSFYFMNVAIVKMLHCVTHMCVCAARVHRPPFFFFVYFSHPIQVFHADPLVSSCCVSPI